jgi:protein SCO1/2
MKILNAVLVLVAALATGGAAANATAPPLGSSPPDSLYQVEGAFEDQDGKKVKLGVARGEIVLMAMFYATCPMVCPMLIADVKRVLAAVPEAERARVRVVLVSLDPARDTPKIFKDVFATRALNAKQFTLLRTDHTTTRTLAATLGVRYRDNGDGSIDHTSKLALLDRHGVVRATRAAVGADTAAFVASIRALLATR